jgi:hypothetical protein
MKLQMLLLGLIAATVALTAFAGPARATIRDRIAYKYSTWFPWHGDHYYPDYRVPIALVVPPTAGNTTEYAWGVGNTRITPNYHQFMRPYPGPYVDPGRYFNPVPPWPSSTTQFGVHYIRGPW